MRSKKNNLIIVGLCSILLLMGIGYAAFSSQLNITGTSNITSTWDVRITNIKSELHGAEDIEEPSYDNTNGLYASFNTGLKRPGDYALYTVTIENRGSVDARIEKINTYYKENKYITFTLSGLSKGDVIKGKETKELQIKVEFNSDVTSIEENISVDLDISIDVAQDSDNPLPANDYYVTYDYSTNGGESSNAVNDYVAEGSNVSLEYTATKAGYEFMGWNTDKDATVGLESLSMPSNNVTLYAIFRKIDTTPPVINNVSTSSTTSSITVVTTAIEEDGEIVKYEYKIDSEEYVAGESNTYTFTGLVQNTNHTIKVRVTNKDNLQVESEEYNVSTKELNVPTFSEEETDNGKTVTITYPEETGLTYEYKKDSGEWQTATQNQKVEFTESGTLVARVSDGTNVVNTSTYTVEVDGAIDIITNLVTTNSNELYIDEHNNIRYYGSNPNNYVTFNNELWRIIGVVDGNVKLIRNSSIGRMAWNSDRNGNWDNSTLKAYLNDSYYNNIKQNKEMIALETYYLGGISSGEYRELTADGFYKAERGNNVPTGFPLYTSQYIGLIYPSDYAYAAGEQATKTPVYNYTDSGNYLYLASQLWVQSPSASDSSRACFLDSTYITPGVNTYNSGWWTNQAFAVYPSLYLTENVKIINGTGTRLNPYQLSAQ